MGGTAGFRKMGSRGFGERTGTGCGMIVEVVDKVHLRPNLHHPVRFRSSVVVGLVGARREVVDVAVDDRVNEIVLDESRKHTGHGNAFDPGKLSTDSGFGSLGGSRRLG